MFWVGEGNQQKSRVRDFCNSVLKCGEIPKHVAFIMDGNRRFAKEKHQPRAQGHESGFQKLAEVCIFTIYIISLENLNSENACHLNFVQHKVYAFVKLLDQHTL